MDGLGGDPGNIFTVYSLYESHRKASFPAEENADFFHKHSFSQMYLKKQEEKIKAKKDFDF